jgi:sporulation protein YlmC with PRC-barrel domain
VITADGHVIGEVAALFFDSGTWQVESLRVKLRNDAADRLGAARGVFHAGMLNLPVSAVQSVGDAVVLSVPALELRKAADDTSGS